MRKSASKSRTSLQDWLQLAQLRSEKCELGEARIAFSMALDEAKRTRNLRAVMEALSGLLRLSGEALDEKSMERLSKELDGLMARYPRQIPPMAWYCKGAVARHRSDARLAQTFFHKFLREVRSNPNPRRISAAQLLTPEESIARGWAMLAITASSRGHPKRARWLAERVLGKYESENFRALNGVVYLLLGNLCEKRRAYAEAMEWYRKAHASFLQEHNWYHHLYVLYGYARLARLQQNYSQAYWYLDLVDHAVQAPEFGLLRREIASERSRLQQDAVDLLIDSRRCIVKTREGGQISLRKQYVLLHILEALSTAHHRTGEDVERGLSKAEIIEKVWKESYRPEAHDNKLYYNINRLRKLIEPDAHKPQYLLNWKEGYRLAPGLRVHFVGGNQTVALRLNQEGESK